MKSEKEIREMIKKLEAQVEESRKNGDDKHAKIDSISISCLSWVLDENNS